MSLAESREDWIVREARKRPLAERSVFLDGACAGDLALRGRIEGRLVTKESDNTKTATSSDADRSTRCLGCRRRGCGPGRICYHPGLEDTESHTVFQRVSAGGSIGRLLS